jgi:anti-sigma B factor antagonist
MPHGSTSVVAVQGQLVVTNRDAFKEAVQGALAAGATRVIIDCATTSYIDSSGLGALVSLSKAALAQGAVVALAALSAELQQLFELKRLDTLLAIHPTVAAARNA